MHLIGHLARCDSGTPALGHIMGRGGAVSVQTHSEVTADMGPSVGNAGYGAAAFSASLQRKSLDAATGPASAPREESLDPSDKASWESIEPVSEVCGPWHA